MKYSKNITIQKFIEQLIDVLKYAKKIFNTMYRITPMVYIMLFLLNQLPDDCFCFFFFFFVLYFTVL